MPAARTLRGLRRVGTIGFSWAPRSVLLSASAGQPCAADGKRPPGTATCSPPSPAPNRRWSLHGDDFGTSLGSDWWSCRERPAPDTFKATVTDYDSGAPIAASGVSLRFTPPRADVGSSRLDLVRSGPGVFSASGTNLSLDGTWGIAAVVANGAASVEVRLKLTTENGFQLGFARRPDRRQRRTLSARPSAVRLSAGQDSQDLRRSRDGGSQRDSRHVLRR